MSDLDGVAGTRGPAQGSSVDDERAAVDAAEVDVDGRRHGPGQHRQRADHHEHHQDRHRSATTDLRPIRDRAGPIPGGPGGRDLDLDPGQDERTVDVLDRDAQRRVGDGRHERADVVVAGVQQGDAEVERAAADVSGHEPVGTQRQSAGQRVDDHRAEPPLGVDAAPPQRHAVTGEHHVERPVVARREFHAGVRGLAGRRVASCNGTPPRVVATTNVSSVDITGRRVDARMCWFSGCVHRRRRLHAAAGFASCDELGSGNRQERAVCRLERRAISRRQRGRRAAAVRRRRRRLVALADDFRFRFAE